MCPWLNPALALLALHGLACEHGDDREAANPPARPAVEGGAPTAPAKMGDAAPPGELERYDGGLVAPAVDLSGRREIVRRECQARRYGDGFTIEPAAVVPGVTCSGATCGPSIECTRPQDCGGSAFVRCLGWAEGVCRYDADAGSVDHAGAYDGGTAAGCVADEDCRAQAGGRCQGVILQTRCQNRPTCGADTECAPNQACLCTANGDRLAWRPTAEPTRTAPLRSHACALILVTGDHSATSAAPPPKTSASQERRQAASATSTGSSGAGCAGSE